MPTGGRRARLRTAAMVAAAALALGTVGACASTSGSSTAARSDRGVGGAGAKPDAGRAVTDGGADHAPTAAVQVLSLTPGEAGRSVVSTATMAVSLDDVVAGKERARVAIEAAGGYLFAEQTNVGATSSATVTYKVPPDRFTSAMADLARLGQLVKQEVKTDDVTQQVVDLDARIRAAEASTARVSSLVERTSSVSELANLENEIQRRQAELESLRGQQRTLAARTDAATIVLTLQTADAPVPAAGGRDDLPGFLDGLGAGGRAMATVATVAAAVLGAVLPFAWLLVVPLGFWLVARRRRAPAAPTPSAP